MLKEDANERAKEFCKLREMTLDQAHLLGQGQEGYVWSTSNESAVKVFERARNFETELECYQILHNESVHELDGFTIPRLLDHDNELQVIEMTIVSPPFLLDFGKAYIGRRPDFTEEVMSDYESDREELFEGNWPLAWGVVSSLEKYGIYYWDARPGNINCKGHPDAI
ncbi:hypothetical protein [Stieleria varia]|uniref:Uncharacterized protein n=1 Tax=Stieleria varia TaxID=2528005 RepID=A0A5C6B4M1_9BACT|nr:hypothetical protein [Stieleria varia]TWU06236.1 hypothetical protein Pla52n_19570 [Stieleria varia]